jgi:hypothetical protein
MLQDIPSLVSQSFFANSSFLTSSYDSSTAPYVIKYCALYLSFLAQMARLVTAKRGVIASLKTAPLGPPANLIAPSAVDT